MNTRTPLFLLMALIGWSPPVLAQNWTLTSAPVTNWCSLAMSADGSRVLVASRELSGVAGSWGGSVFASTNSGASWQMLLPYNQTNASWPDPFVDWTSVACSADGGKMFAMGVFPGDSIGPIPFYFS